MLWFSTVKNIFEMHVLCVLCIQHVYKLYYVSLSRVQSTVKYQIKSRSMFCVFFFSIIVTEVH